MMSKPLFQNDAYQRECSATVIAVVGAQVIVDQTVFYPLGGGQPGDSGELIGPSDQHWPVIDTRKGEEGTIVHHLDSEPDLKAGDPVTLRIDWPRRYAHMRMHTALHLLGSLIPHGVTGGNISATKGRLDFDMADTVDKEALTQQLNELIRADHAVTCRWISDEELDAQPELVRTMSVQPPRGSGQVRLLEIADVDLQPCGGTHVRQTAEIGPVAVSKVEKKGKHNRRVSIVFAE
ncbi:MAG: alanyl-tRNA editing protein [Wenzhouxiangellaceae bacterium]